MELKVKVDLGEIFFGDTVQTSKGAMTNIQFRPYYYNSMFQYIISPAANNSVSFKLPKEGEWMDREKIN